MSTSPHIELLDSDIDENTISWADHSNTRQFNKKHKVNILYKNTTEPSNQCKPSTINIAAIHRMIASEKIKINKACKHIKTTTKISHKMPTR